MIGASVATALLGVVAVTGSPLKMSSRLIPRQSTLHPDPLDPVGWCVTQDMNNAENVVDIWEDWGIGAWMEVYISQNIGPSDEQWPIKLAQFALPTSADLDISGCGVIGATTCDPEAVCTEMVGRGFGFAYWGFDALKGFHSKLQIAHEKLQDTVIDDILSLDEIASGSGPSINSAPAAFNSMAEIAGIVSSALFLVGGVGGIAGVAAGAAATNAVGRLGRSNAVLAIEGLSDPTRAFFEDERNKEQAEVDKASSTARGAGALSGATYLMGSVFSVISASTDAQGQVTSGDLAPILRELFAKALTNLEDIGKLATGGIPGGNYNLLPHAAGVDGLAIGDPIAGFFSDGRWLIGDSDISFNNTITAGYASLKMKIVDQALQTGLFQVLSDSSITTLESCKEGYGAEWMDIDGGLCMQLYRESPEEVTCPYDPLSLCSWAPASQTDIDNLGIKYGFTMYDYYMAAYDCAVNGPDDRKPDTIGQPLDGSLPTCWYSIIARKAEFSFTSLGPTGEHGSQHVEPPHGVII